MNSGDRVISSRDEVGACPILVEWKPGAGRPALSADEIRVWLIELDAGLEGEAEVEGVEPGPELEVLDADEKRVRRGLCGRATGGDSRVAAPPCGKFWAVCLASGRSRSGFGRLLAASPSWTRPIRPAAGRRFGSMSRTRRIWRVIAVCRDRELGVDLEHVRPMGEAARIVESFFSEAEQAEFAAIAGPSQSAAFMRGWTRKEAILKGLGVGIAGLADRYETGFGTGEVAGQFAPAVPCFRVGPWQLWEASPRAGFVATLACSTAG